jgi:hypothetical protein
MVKAVKDLQREAARPHRSGSARSRSQPPSRGRSAAPPEAGEGEEEEAGDDVISTDQEVGLVWFGFGGCKRARSFGSFRCCRLATWIGTADSWQ